MKHPVSKKNFSHWAPALLRHCTVAERVHIECPVRKCRRDGWCTGPLVMIHGDDMPCLAPPERSAVPPGATLIPVCFFCLPDDSHQRVEAAYLAGAKARPDDSGATVTEPTRATGARRWKKLQIGDVALSAE
jgi:hypothetical protein